MSSNCMFFILLAMLFPTMSSLTIAHYLRLNENSLFEILLSSIQILSRVITSMFERLYIQIYEDNNTKLISIIIYNYGLF
jgi:hypothetical protein